MQVELILPCSFCTQMHVESNKQLIQSDLLAVSFPPVSNTVL